MEYDWFCDFLDLDAIELPTHDDLPFPLESEVGADPSSITPNQKPFRLTATQRTHLVDWVNRHPEPYPTRGEKESLAKLTGLTGAQISSWFSRLRQRKLRRVNPLLSPLVNPFLNPVSNPFESTNALLSSFEQQASVQLLPSHGQQEQVDFQGQFSNAQRPFIHGGSLGTDIGCVSDDGKNCFVRAASLPPVLSLRHLRHFPPRSHGKHDSILSLEAIASPRPDPCLSTMVMEKQEQHPRSPWSSCRSLFPEPTSKNAYIMTWLQKLEAPETSSEESSTAPGEKDTSPLFPEETAFPLAEWERYLCSPDENLWPSIKPLDYPFPEFNPLDSTPVHGFLAPGRVKTPDPRWTAPTDYSLLPESAHGPSTPFAGLASYTGASSDHASSYGSAGSASSFVSLGPRKGRRMVFEGSNDDVLFHDHDSPLPAETTPSQVVQLTGLSDGVSLGDVNPLDDEILQGFPEPDQPMLPEALEEDCEKPPSKKRKRTRTKTQSQTQASYACTVCHRQFPKRYTWERHEKSTHFACERWICGNSLSKNVSQDCPICATEGDNPRPMGQCGHRFPDCLLKPEVDRTFYRRDAIKQHLKVFHCKDQAWPKQADRLQLDDWKVDSNLTPPSLVCHFCCFQPRNWEARVQHISSHFETGTDISQWKSSSPNSLTRPLSGRYLSYITCPANGFLSEILKSSRSQTVIKLPNANEGSSWIVCPLCNLTLWEKVALREHCRSMHTATIVQHIQDHPGKVLRCPFCKEDDSPSITLDPTNVYCHMLDHTFPGVNTADGTQCPLCRCSVLWTEFNQHLMECITDMFVSEAEDWGCHAFYI
ncbi:hypothetical protein PG985_000015 [Apiospora marii]|uniref:uncharacterized protein n=1 Tax=Apiospora marii TaxID=335849 RepID=UPI00312D0989